MQEQHSSAQDTYSKFIAFLPKDLPRLRELLQWYQEQQNKCIAILNNPKQIVKLVYDNDHENDFPFGDYQELELRANHSMMYTTAGFLEKFISHYNSTLLAEKLMLGRFIDEIELEHKQQRWN